MLSLGPNVSEPWLSMGDCNHLLNLEDRMAGAMVPQQDIDDFQQCG